MKKDSVKKKSVKNIEEQLRDAVNESELSINAIAMRAGVPQAAVARFATGERSLILSTAARLATYFGMRLTMPRKPKRE